MKFLHYIERKQASMANVRKLLAKNLKNLREIYGLSQMELAEMISCSPTLIGKIETMKRFPSADNIDRLTEAFKIAPTDLFTDTTSSEVIKTKASQQKRKSQLKMKILKAIDEEFIV